MMTLTDPLATQEVVISIVVQVADPVDTPQLARPIVLTLGVPGQPPVIKTGVYGDCATLIEAAWRTFDPTPEVTTPTTPATTTTAPPQQGLLDLF